VILKSSQDYKQINDVIFQYPDYINCHVSLPTWLFICCNSDLFVLGTTQLKTMTESTSTDELLKELLATVNSLKKDVD